MKYSISIIIAALSLRCNICISQENEESSSPRVVTPLGTIEGYYKLSNDGRTYEAYQGIPYAHPPIGDSRFEVAKPLTSPWTGVLTAKTFGSPCMQWNFFLLDSDDKVDGNEDCLYLNVYTTVGDSKRLTGETDAKDLLPVIFFIPGGAFQFDSGAPYGPAYLLDNDVILVTFNYRLGPLGFLSTEDNVVPGNMGLKDQVLALRWVRDNIQSFGGDPSRVTIIGHSAGGASAHYHYMSKLSTGLFKRGMSLSGTALDCWTQTENSLDKAKRLASIVECPTSDIKTMVECLKQRPAYQIVRAVGEFMPWLYNPFSPFGPVVEKGDSEFKFIDRSPIEIISSGVVLDLPWITGVTSNEGLFPAFVARDSLLEELADNWQTIAPHLLDFNYTIPQSEHAQVSRLIKEHYLGQNQISKSTINQLVQIIGDRLFVYEAERAARLQAKVNKSPVKFYYFAYRGAHSVTELLSGTNENSGVCHGDDVAYAMDVFFDSTTSAEDQKMQKKLTNFWVSYATNGVPDMSIDWPNLNDPGNDFPYLFIASPQEISVKNHQLDIGEKNFWQTINFNENIISSSNYGDEDESEL